MPVSNIFVLSVKESDPLPPGNNVSNISKKLNLRNPCYIPRNHLIEDALMNAVDGDMKEINLIAELLKEPFTEKHGFEKYSLAPSSNEPYITYCGT